MFSKLLRVQIVSATLFQLSLGVETKQFEKYQYDHIPNGINSLLIQTRVVLK